MNNTSFYARLTWIVFKAALFFGLVAFIQHDSVIPAWFKYMIFWFLLTLATLGYLLVEVSEFKEELNKKFDKSLRDLADAIGNPRE